MSDLLHGLNHPRSVENRLKEVERSLKSLQARVLRKNGAAARGLGPTPPDGGFTDPSPTLAGPDAADVTVGVTHNYSRDGVWLPTLTASVNTANMASVEGLYGFRWYITDPLGNKSVYTTVAAQDVTLPIAVAPSLGLTLRPTRILPVLAAETWQISVATLSLTGGESAATPLPPVPVDAPTATPPAPTGVTISPRTLALFVHFDPPNFGNYAWTEASLQPASYPGERIFVMSTTSTGFILPWDKYNYEESVPHSMDTLVLVHVDTFGNRSAETLTFGTGYQLLNQDNLEVVSGLTPGTYNSMTVGENGTILSAANVNTHFDKHYWHVQSVASTDWTVTHGFGSLEGGVTLYPTFVAYSATMVPITPIAVSYDDYDTLLLTFSAAKTGYVAVS